MSEVENHVTEIEDVLQRVNLQNQYLEQELVGYVGFLQFFCLRCARDRLRTYAYSFCQHPFLFGIAPLIYFCFAGSAEAEAERART